MEQEHIVMAWQSKYHYKQTASFTGLKKEEKTRSHEVHWRKNIMLIQQKMHFLSLIKVSTNIPTQ